MEPWDRCINHFMKLPSKKCVVVCCFVLIGIVLFLVLWGFFNVYRTAERANCYVHFKDQSNAGAACDTTYSIPHIIFNFGQWH